MKKLVIFDLDGTLLNTIEDLSTAANYALEKHGYPLHEVETYQRFVGNGVRKLLERALPPDARTEAEVEKLYKLFEEYYDDHCVDFTKPYPGIMELLEQLKSKGIAMAIASNKYQRATSKIVKTIFPDIPWVAVEGSREGVPRKPDPSIIFNILLKHPTPKAEVLYVGDSGLDMEAARRACVESVGVTWGFRPYKELRESYAGHIVSRPEEIFTLADLA